MLARAIQLFTPVIPKVCYVGLLAGGNDMDLLARSGVGRDINRHRYTRAEIDRDLTRPVVVALVGLIRHRNTHPAFAGTCAVGGQDDRISLTWTHGAHTTSLGASLGSRRATLTWTGIDGQLHMCDNLLNLWGRLDSRVGHRDGPVTRHLATSFCKQQMTPATPRV